FSVMRGCKRMNKERDYFFDNLKAVLIFLVVLGHFLLPIHGESVLVVVKRLIYVFHMPLFVFVSGYFAKKIYKNGQYNFKKILYLIKAYIMFVVAIQIVYAIVWISKIYGDRFLLTEWCTVVSVCHDCVVSDDTTVVRECTSGAGI
ncbi:MAG: acyltransferase family protein, partial [Eubacterium sp.]